MQKHAQDQEKEVVDIEISGRKPTFGGKDVPKIDATQSNDEDG